MFAPLFALALGAASQAAPAPPPPPAKTTIVLIEPKPLVQSEEYKRLRAELPKARTAAALLNSTEIADAMDYPREAVVHNSKAASGSGCWSGPTGGSSAAVSRNALGRRRSTARRAICSSSTRNSTRRKTVAGAPSPACSIKPSSGSSRIPAGYSRSRISHGATVSSSGRKERCEAASRKCLPMANGPRRRRSIAKRMARSLA